MEFITIENREDFRAEEIYEAYCRAFPEDERRNVTQFSELFGNPHTRVIAVLHELDFVGYLVLWQLSSFVFLEHLEIFPEFRNRTMGSAVLKHLAEHHTHVFLECEPPDKGEFATKRIDFYLKSGYAVIDENYTQPSYDQTKKPLAMYLLSNWQPENLAIITEEIYDIVYHK